MDITTTLCTILEQVAPGCGADQLSPTDNIRDELEIDSFDFLNFIVALSEQLAVEIPEGDYQQIQTLEQLIDYLRQRGVG